MKAILMGHVPPARTESKQSWDETCWQKYTLWMRQYRDLIVGSVYGHMNIDHFMLQDFEDISNRALKGEAEMMFRSALDDELTIQSSADYLTELRADWSGLPDTPKFKAKIENVHDLLDSLAWWKKHKPTEEEKYLKKIGGLWGERYSLSLVSPSVVPNYFPTLRVVEYNISGLDAGTLHSSKSASLDLEYQESGGNRLEEAARETLKKKKDTEDNKTKKRKSRKPKKPVFVTPKPPSKSAPPGPAYSPQTLSWLGHTQYYANLTVINDDFSENKGDVRDQKWHEGKHSGKKPKEKSKKHHKKFRYEVEYTTRNDSIFSLKDLTVRSYIELADRIGQYKPRGGDNIQEIGHPHEDTPSSTEEEIAEKDAILCTKHDLTTEKNKTYKKHHGKKHKHRKIINKTWFTFVDRAYVGTRDEEDLHDQFG